MSLAEATQGWGYSHIKLRLALLVYAIIVVTCSRDRTLLCQSCALQGLNKAVVLICTAKGYTMLGLVMFAGDATPC